MLLPFALTGFHGLLLLIPATRPFGIWLIGENRPIELTTFVVLLLAAILSLRLAFRPWLAGTRWLAPPFYGLFGLGMFLIAMEEISWGQWFFGFSTPEEIRTANLQGEFNFHNLQGAHVLIEYMRLAFGLGGLIGIAAGYTALLRPVAAPPILLPWFGLIVLLSAADLILPELNVPQGAVHLLNYLTETIELLIGLAALIYIWLKYRDVRLDARYPDQPAAAGGSAGQNR